MERDSLLARACVLLQKHNDDLNVELWLQEYRNSLTPTTPRTVPHGPAIPLGGTKVHPAIPEPPSTAATKTVSEINAFLASDRTCVSPRALSFDVAPSPATVKSSFTKRPPLQPITGMKRHDAPPSTPRLALMLGVLSLIYRAQETTKSREDAAKAGTEILSEIDRFLGR